MKGRRRLVRPHDYLNLRGLARPVVFRPNTTDIPVAWELFRNAEYATPTWPFRTVVDCGANCGMFLAWALWRSGGQLERYVGVEADADSFRTLQHQADSLAIDERAVLINAAIWEHDGSVAFDESGPSWGHHVGTRAGGRAVRAMALESILDEAGLAECDLLKLDIEGGERRVLPAVMATCSERVNALVAELHDGLTYDWFAHIVERAGFIAAPPGTLFHSHPGAIRKGSALEWCFSGDCDFATIGARQ